MALPTASAMLLGLALRGGGWVVRWTSSGAAILSIMILFGSANGYRVLPFVPLYALLATFNLAYSIAATSWILWWLFAIMCYPTILVVSVLQFDFMATFLRRSLRFVLKELSFVKDMVALFNVPGLAIDVDVVGLMAIRGLTLQLSSLTVIAHDVEVGIKLTDELEISIVTDRVEIHLLRDIIIGDCYANVKEGTERSLHKVLDEKAVRPHLHRNASDATEEVLKPIRQMKALSPEDSHADEFQKMIDWIEETGMIEQSRRAVLASVEVRARSNDEDLVNVDKIKELRAAICSKMQAGQTVPHPPSTSIKVSTLKQMMPPKIEHYLMRMPLLLRLLLNPIAYLHPVKVSSITAAGSGRHIAKMLDQFVFKGRTGEDGELGRLYKRINEWLCDANFIVELVDISGLASVPIITSYDIMALLQVEDIVASRMIDKKEESEQVCRFGGGDASFLVPSYLLPHHQHLLPRKATRAQEADLIRAVDTADDKLDKVIAEGALEQAENDETNVKMSAHISLPVAFSQDVLDFIAALVKASKLVEMESEMEGVHGLKVISKGLKESIKKTTVESIVNDSWIAKMVGKITKKLEEAKGDIGYSGNIPVQLKKYRLPDNDPLMKKILP
ncbi:hypothetical protein BD324DRAFT_630401 [Kockovaella imperatae]|uniref:Uncharacterized protein n=1 Tax=Kockovaella imperatae TaxID=4999 RepID=A0A1Y1UF65_9TREE|nr:hypothetical protein BD324DRAFT_630401 [Kockovaella imperatae]ORX36154.1 hypothetical protein BD324DRAFT_630401 [Kockovaella imperatae]